MFRYWRSYGCATKRVALYRFRTFLKEIILLSCRMVIVFGKIMHAEFALCKNYDFASLKYDRISTYSANFSSICAGRRIQFEPKSRAEICSAGRYRPAPPTVARTLVHTCSSNHSLLIFNLPFKVMLKEVWGCFLRSEVNMLHFSKDMIKIIKVHQHYSAFNKWTNMN